MKTVSIYQWVARVMITVMLAGAILLLVGFGYVIITGQRDIFNEPDKISVGLNAARSVIQPISFLLELVGLIAWTLLISLYFPGSSSALGKSYSLGVFIGGVIVEVLLLAVLIALLILSRYLTRRKGARTACAVFLGLILIDLPSTLMFDHIMGMGDFWLAVGQYISLGVHFAAAILLILSLRHIYEHREEYSDFTRPKQKPPILGEEQIMTPQGTIAENALTRASNDMNRQRNGAAVTARVLTIVMCICTMLTVATIMLEWTIYTKNVTQPSWIPTIRDFLSTATIVFFTLGSYVLPNLSLLMTGSSEPTSVVAICQFIITILFAAALLWGQRYFTKKHWLTRPMLILTLTVTVIDTMPYLSPLISIIPSAALHGVLIGMLIAAIRKTE